MSKVQSVSKPKVSSVDIVIEPSRVTLRGTIAMQTPGEHFAPFFKALHDAALEDGLRELQVDVTGVTFVNSSAIRLFVDWATWLKREPESRRYLLRFVTNMQITWQKTSFGVLRSLAKEVIAVDS